MTTMHEMAKKGIPLKDVLIIDEHCHMGAAIWNYIPDGSAKAIVAEMDNLGIDIACVSHNASLGADYKWGNDRIIEAIRMYPDRFTGYCTINPHYPEEIPGELERCFKNKAMKGIKLHPWFHERTLAYKNYRPVFEFAAKTGCCIMAHVYVVVALIEVLPLPQATVLNIKTVTIAETINAFKVFLMLIPSQIMFKALYFLLYF